MYVRIKVNNYHIKCLSTPATESINSVLNKVITAGLNVWTRYGFYATCVDQILIYCWKILVQCVLFH
jgi:hypothetical protein